MERKKVLITGASRGIGLAIAKEFAKNGYDLFLTCCHNIEKLEKEAKSMEEQWHIQCKCYCFSIASESGVNTMFEDITDLDVLVNNAGISHVGLLTDMSFEEWHEIMDVNLNSSFLTCKKAIPLMVRKHQGKIINISSVWGNVGASMEVAYSTTKGGINSFTKALAKELAPSNVQVNAVACGLIDTDMNHCFSQEEIDAVIEEIPADRIGKPEEVAELVLQLCTDNTYLTGQIISIDGGWI